MNKALRAANFTNSNSTTTSLNTNPPNKAVKEDYIEKVNLLPTIIDHLSSRKKDIFSGTDPGTVMTSITVPMTLESIFAGIDHFQVLASAEDSSNEEAPSKFDIDPLPKPYKITAGLFNKATFLKKHQINHQWRQKCGVDEEIQYVYASPPSCNYDIINKYMRNGSQACWTKKIQEHHRVYGHAGITNKYNTSKTYSYYFSKVVLHKAHRYWGFIIEGV